MQKKRIRIILFIFSLLISFAAFSQEFVVKETGDTLFGEVKVKKGGGYKISVKPKGVEEFLEFTGKDIQAYETGKKGFLQSKEKAIYSFFVQKRNNRRWRSVYYVFGAAYTKSKHELI